MHTVLGPLGFYTCIIIIRHTSYMYHTCIGSADPDRCVHQQHDVPSPTAEVDDRNDRRQFDGSRRTSDEG